MYYLSILAIMKNEDFNIKEWVDHYIWQGVEHIYLIDNGSDDNSVGLVNELINKGYPITLYINNIQHKQVEHYRYVYDTYKLRETTKWLLICDLDEFLYCKEKKLSDVLKNYENYTQIITHWRLFGTTYDKHPPSLRTDLIYMSNNNGYSESKYIFQTKDIPSDHIWVHYLINLPIETIDLTDIIKFNHYQTQSKEYYEKVKTKRGDAYYVLGEKRTWDIFYTINKESTILNDELKLLILKHNETIEDFTNVSNCNIDIYIILVIIFILLIIYFYK